MCVFEMKDIRYLTDAKASCSSTLYEDFVNQGLNFFMQGNLYPFPSLLVRNFTKKDYIKMCYVRSFALFFLFTKLATPIQFAFCSSSWGKHFFHSDLTFRHFLPHKERDCFWHPAQLSILDNCQTQSAKVWPCLKNRIIKTISSIPHNICDSFKSGSLYFGLGKTRIRIY